MGSNIIGLVVLKNANIRVDKMKIEPYAYCQNDTYGIICAEPLSEPTLRQALELEPWICKWGHSNKVNTRKRETIAKQFEKLTERIENIERHLWPENED